MLSCVLILLMTLDVTSLATRTGIVAPRTGKVVVAGGTGRTGREVVKELLSRSIGPNSNETISLSVVVPARNVDSAAKIFSGLDRDRLDIIQCDLSDTNGIAKLCKDADAVVWCATGFSDSSSFLDKLKGAFMLKFMPRSTIDISAMAEFGYIFQKLSYYTTYACMRFYPWHH